MVAGVTEQEMVSGHLFPQLAAIYVSQTSDLQALRVMQLAATFPSRDPSLFRELGAYAYTVGELDLAEDALLRSKEFSAERSHLWEKIAPTEGGYTRIPDEVRLPILEAKMKRVYEALCPENHLSPEQRTSLAGVLDGICFHAHRNLESSIRFSVFKMAINSHKGEAPRSCGPISERRSYKSLSRSSEFCRWLLGPLATVRSLHA